MASLLPHARRHLKDGWKLRDSRESITAYAPTAFYTRPGCVLSTDTRDTGLVHTVCTSIAQYSSMLGTPAIFAACDSCVAVGPSIRVRPPRTALLNAHAYTQPGGILA